ncbi:MAG TPA: glycosyltransferase family 2 protein [Lachnospiraceae bacterium]|nr:glycosyltransferase family 2 protein [Lachnospiraceae bacterium]
MTETSAVLIILNYNDKNTTQTLVNAIKGYTCLHKIIVVDNSSSDGSFAYLKKTLTSDKVDLIQAPENGGYAKGNNFGIRYAIKTYAPDYLFIANPDIMVKEPVLSVILKTMEQQPDYGIMSCLVNQGYNVWNLPGFAGMIESLFLLWFNLDKYMIRKKLLSSANALEPVGVIEGSFFCIKKTAYEAIGGLDERTFLYAEEIILSRRLSKKDLKAGILTKERFDHFHSVSIKKAYRSSKAKAFHNFYNSFRIYNKEYLHTSPLQDGIFAAAYKLAYIERIIYDLVMRIKR